MFSASKRLSKDKLNGPEGVPLVGTYDLTPLAALPPQAAHVTRPAMINQHI